MSELAHRAHHLGVAAAKSGTSAVLLGIVRAQAASLARQIEDAPDPDALAEIADRLGRIDELLTPAPELERTP
jgi:hypothetical protein